MEWVHPSCPLAHPLDDGSAVLLERSVPDTAAGLGPDRDAYQRLFGPVAAMWEKLAGDLLGGLRWPAHPLAMARFGLRAIWPAVRLARQFVGPRARALLAGLAGHSMLPLDHSPSGAFALVLGTCGHAVGWPMVRGGSQRLTDALVACLKSLGGQVITCQRVGRLDQLGRPRLIFLDVSPRQLLDLASEQLPGRYRLRLSRFRYGTGVFKLDYALAGPIPWRSPECLRAATVHIGGTFEEIAHAEAQAAAGTIPDRPFVLLAQQSLFDPTRSPPGRHTAWAYCHVPNGSTVDMTEPIERQIERFAPGFRDLILARHARNSAAMEIHNPNYVGGDIGGGSNDLRQLLLRPVLGMSRYRTGIEGVYLCSASTPPGAGVHGMCGYNAARAALRHMK